MTHIPSIGQEQLDHLLPVMIEEISGIDRIHEPVTVGLPFPKGSVKKRSELSLLDPQGHNIPLQTQTLDRWPDQSIKWVLFDFQATVAAKTITQYTICYGETSGFQQKGQQYTSFPSIELQQDTDSIIVNTGVVTFVVNTRVFKPFEQVIVEGQNVLDTSNTRVELLDDSDQKYEHSIENVFVETAGLLRTTLKFEGYLIAESKESFADFFARIHFYTGCPVSKLEYTLRNPKPARHPGGLWDLGDEGSIYFNDLSFHFALSTDQSSTIAWTTQPEKPLINSDTGKIEIYQDSSGGKNWKSSNHMNRSGKVMHSFRGYRVTGDTLLEEGTRAHPIVTIQDGVKRITGAVRRFWENFPKAIEARENILTIRLFPIQYQDLFELQGGEQKTQSIFLSFATLENEQSQDYPQSFKDDVLNWIQEPLIPHASPEWYAQSQAFEYLIPSIQDPHPELIALMNEAIEGENTFFDRREIIDEYGWRNFGDLYADHEAAYYEGEGQPTSHYNNQYDCIYGMIIQYVRSGNLKWFILMNDLAHHVIDIDIYHTDQDKPNYSGGLFWHTDHYVDVGTGTHRGFSKMIMIAKGFKSYGGGPSNEHDYPTGLRYHYYLTGEPASKETAIGLADWVIRMDDGRQTKFKFLNSRPTGSASQSTTHDYHGPGRGGGFSINALLDGYLLTKDRKYLAKAEQLVQRCIHPQDNIEERELTDAEERWSYTVFLQVLGRYLDLKVELHELDEMYCYARESLLHYAIWMREHEVRSCTILDTLEFPTETWPAQDIRKSNVFKFAAKYSQEPLRSQFLEKAEYFFSKPLEDLYSFKTKTLTRPLILLMTNTAMHAYFQKHSDDTAPQVECPGNFGQPHKFKPQLYHVHKLRTWSDNILNSVKTILGR